MNKYSSSEKSPLLTNGQQKQPPASRKPLYYKINTGTTKSHRKNPSQHSTLNNNATLVSSGLVNYNGMVFSNDVVGEIFSFLSIENVQLLDSVDSKVLVANLSALAKLSSTCRQFRDVMLQSNYWDALFEYYVFFCTGEYHGLTNPMLYYKIEKQKLGDQILLTQCQKKHFVMYGIMFDYVRKRQLFSSQFMNGVVNKTVHSIDFKHYPQRNIIRAAKRSNSHIDPQFAKKCRQIAPPTRNDKEKSIDDKKTSPELMITNFACDVFCRTLFRVPDF